MAKMVMTSKECRKYRRYIYVETMLEAIVVLLIIILAGLTMFYAGMLFERTNNELNNSSSSCTPIVDISD